MRVQIETYRDWDICFDTSEEVFSCISGYYDKELSSKSYKAVKKQVDDFIKDNAKFEPFEVERISSTYENEDVIKIIGVRKDGKLMFEGKDGDKKQLSEWSERDYIMINPENEKYKTELREISGKIKELGKLQDETEKKIIKVTLKDLRSQGKFSF
jgi:hypothetical protein